MPPMTRPAADADLKAPRYTDVNAVVGGYLRDLAFAQPSQQQMFGYKRAANAILAPPANSVTTHVAIITASPARCTAVS
jgi:hypothetical protein